MNGSSETASCPQGPALRCTISPLLRFLARFRPFRPSAVAAACFLERGQMWSATFRNIMADFYGVQIGMHTYGAFAWPANIPEGTRIGNYCSLASGIVIFRRNHPTNRFSQHPFFFNSSSGMISDDTIVAVKNHPLQIEHDVWIGANVIITPRCNRIGLGAVIGAGSVVTKDVSPFEIVAGVPARKVGERFPPDIREVLLKSEWWDYPMASLLPHISLFTREATLENAVVLRNHLQGLTKKEAAPCLVD